MSAPMTMLRTGLGLCRKFHITCGPSFIARCGYAKKAAIPVASKQSKAELEVEQDPERLTKYCCGLNIYKEGEEIELKPDSEYPDWLWELRTERGPVPIEELDPMTWAYWRRVKRMSLRRDNKLQSMKFKKP